MPGSMTPLSRSEAYRAWTILDLPAVARLSLYGMVSMLFGVPTCLVTNTTEFPEAVPSAPFINPNTASATVEGRLNGVPPTKMIFIDPGTDTPGIKDYKSLTLSAEVQSEDNGRSLFARAFGDYKVSEKLIVAGGLPLEPGTFDEKRKISVVLTADNLERMGPGCHQVALVVSHLFDNVTFEPVNSGDTTFVVWWLLIEHDDGDPNTPVIAASSCPPGLPAPGGDAGINAEAGP